jgi:1-acyl-sn-glycerol-3-phosphate acyltransferase
VSPFSWRIPPDIDARVEALEIPFNRHGLDRYGTSKTELKRWLRPASWLYRKYMDMSVFGTENVPASGRAMLVGNHSGGVALDGALIWTALMLELNPPRLAHGMAEKFLNVTPFTSQWTNRTGQLTGLPEHAIRLLEDDRLLMVFPEGARGTAKLYRERYSLVRFGTGFMRLAMQTNTPIVPVAFLGGGEAIPTIHNSKLLGRLTGAPYVPFTPWVLALPRPASCQIYFGPAMEFEGSGNEADEVIQDHVDQVKQAIRGMLDHGIERRRGRHRNAPVQWPGEEA